MKTPKKLTTAKLGRLSWIKILTFAAVLILPAATGLAQNYWQGPTNGAADYNIATNWVGNVVPTGGSANPANDNGSNSVILIQAGDPTWSVNSVRAGWENNASGSYLQTGGTVTTVLKFRLAAGNNGTANNSPNSGSFGFYTISNGVINSGNDFNIGELGTAVVNVNGGAINLTSGGNFAVNNYNGSGNTGTNAVTDVLNQTAGIITVTGAGQLFVGNGGAAIYNMSGGTNTVSNYIAFGRSGGNGTVNMTGGLLVQNGGGNLLVGTGFQNPTGGTPWGVLNQTGGKINCLGQFLCPENSPATGTYNLSGTGALIVNNWFVIGRSGGNGVLNLTNGFITKTSSGNDFLIGSGATGTLNQYGGAITNTASLTRIGDGGGTGVWNFNGGIANLAVVDIIVGSGGHGTLNLNGGVMTLQELTTANTAAVSILTLNGGTLQASGNNPTFLHDVSLVNVSSGGAIFDSQNYNITVSQSLPTQLGGEDNSGGLTKLGSGTLTLTGPNSYAGDTAINAGTLITGTSSTAPGNVTVADNAGFGVIVQSAGGQYNPANVTLGSSVGTSLNFDLGGFGNPPMSQAPLNVSGTFTQNGTTTVYITDALPQIGEFPLVHYGTLAGSGNFVIGSLPTGVTANIVTNAGNSSIDLNISVVNQPRWEGLAGGNWDIGITTNWINLGTGQPTYYGNGVPVLFDDEALGTTTVNLTTTVNPYSVTVTNNNLNYTFVGSGSISGSIGFNKQGSGILSVLNNNGYTGPTVVSGGVLNVTNLANGGSPSPLGASSSSPTNLVINAATLEFSGAPMAVNRGFTANAAGATIDAESNLTLGGQVAAGSTAGFVKTGPAQLAFTATGVNQLGNNSNPGTQVQQGALLLDGSAGGQVNHNFNEMWIGCTTASGGALILSNTTLNVDNWIGLGRINGGINNTSSITLYNSALTCGNLSLGWDGGQPNNLSSQFVTLNGNSTFTNNGAVNLPEGANASMTFTVNDTSLFRVQNPFYICLADNTTGTVVVANSGKIIQTGGWFDVGNGNNCVASLLVKDTATVSLPGDCNLADTAGGTYATVTVQDSGKLTANNLFVGKSANSVCTFNLAGSATGSFGNFMRLADGSSSTGDVNISGGSLTFSQYMNMAAGSGSIAHVTMTGGSLTGGNDMTVGDQATAVVTMNGGVLTVPNTIYLSRGSGIADGTVNLNASGTIVASYVNNGWAFNQGTNSPLFNPNAFNFNGGTLKSYSGANPAFPFIQANVNVVVQAGGAIIDDNGAVRYVDAGLVDGGGGGGLTKLGSGSLALNGTNTYTGTTLVSAGALAGVGSFAGPVNVATGATLAPGNDAIGTLTINNSLTLSNSSTTLMKVSLDGGATNNDMVTGLTTVNYNGTLAVTNSGAYPLVVGAQFQLFAAGSHSGNFANAASVAIQPVGTGSFDANTGKLTITSTGIALIINPVAASGSNLILSGSGGAAGKGYTWLSSTNVATPVNAWTTNTTGTFSATGTFSNAIPIDPTEPEQFLRLRMP